jgi:hypothetical protein
MTRCVSALTDDDCGRCLVVCKNKSKMKIGKEVVENFKNSAEFLTGSFRLYGSTGAVAAAAAI